MNVEGFHLKYDFLALNQTKLHNDKFSTIWNVKIPPKNYLKISFFMALVTCEQFEFFK
jgi:hypothetical protein